MAGNTRSLLSRIVLTLSMCAALILAVGATSPRAAYAAPANRIYFAGKNVYLNGVNMPWNDYARDFGCNYNANYFETAFSNMQAYGVNSTRIWVHTDGRCSPTFDGSGNVTGVPSSFYANMDDFLNRAKNHNVGVILVLWAHEIDGRYNNGINHMDLIYNSAKTDTYINNVLVPMVQRYKNNPAVLAWEVFNEHEWLLPGEQGGGRPTASKTELQRFIGKLAGAVNRNTSQYVTVGAAMYKYMCDKIGSNPLDNATCYGNYLSDSALTSASGDSQGFLDFYQVHYYNWQAPYWSFFTSQGPGYYLNTNKPVIIGEWGIDANQGKTQFLNDMYNTGYAGGVAWSYWYDPCCGGGWDQIKNELKAFRDAHAGEVDINLGGSGGGGGGAGRNSAWAAKLVTSGGWTNLAQNVTVSSNTNHSASVWLKGGGTMRMVVHVLNSNGSWGSELGSTACNASGSWQQCSLSFNSGGNTRVVYRLTDSNGGGATIYMDDTFIGPSGGANKLGNAGFESGNTTWFVQSPFSIVNTP